MGTGGPAGSEGNLPDRRRRPPVVHQAGPPLLWDLVDNIRHAWLTDGKLPAYGATVAITPDGSVQLTRGRWQAIIPAG
jgi:hypothetical protein